MPRVLSRLSPSARLPLLGLAFVVLLVGLIIAAMVDYAGGFTSHRDVTMYATRAGNQLKPGSQVKLHGAVVGTVTRMDTSDGQAKLTLGLDPKYTRLIPKNVKARILPKTLVGQDYVDLVLPDSPSTTAIRAGDVITRDRSATSVQLETALNSLLTTLNKVPPQKLAVTLNAVSSALSGRGDQLGETLDTLQQYLAGLNPSVPRLIDDARNIVATSKTYDQAAPELLDALRSLTTTSRTLVAQKASLAKLYGDTTRAANTTQAFLSANGDNLIDLTASSRHTLGILATYAPEYPCLLNQLNALVPKLDKALGKGTAEPSLHVTLQVSESRGKYLPGKDLPAYDDTRGPRCYPLVKVAPQYPAGGPIQDGSAKPPGAPGIGRLAPASPTAPSLDTAPNSRAETGLISGLFASDGKGAPSWSSLLLGPLLRGSEVGAP